MKKLGGVWRYGHYFNYGEAIWDLTAINFEGSENYATNDDMIKAFQRYGEKIDYNAPVKLFTLTR